MTPVITDTALESLNEAVGKLQAALFDREAEIYQPADLYEVLVRWLESSIEQLAEDACELCLTGDRTHGSFNRVYFEQLLKAKPSRSWADEKAQAEREMADHLAAGLDRAA